MKQYMVDVYYGDAKALDQYLVNAEDAESAKMETIARVVSETDFDVFHEDFAILNVQEVEE